MGGGGATRFLTGFSSKGSRPLPRISHGRLASLAEEGNDFGARLPSQRPRLAIADFPHHFNRANLGGFHTLLPPWE
ncbi:MAG: hypothetical protein ACLQOO_19920, partial [Terriglobia bacterium]